MRKSFLIDSLCNQIKFKRNTISEIEKYFNELQIELSSSDINFSYIKRASISIMKEVFEEMFLVIDSLQKDSDFTLLVLKNIVESSCDTN